MTDLDRAQRRFKEKVGELLLSIQTIRTIDTLAFNEVDTQARLVALLLKGSEFVSKSLLNEFHMASRILRAEAPYFKDKSDILVKMADQLDLTFDLILRGECHGDRVPGVPRII